MSERLVVRLGSEASHDIHWLIWSSNEKEIIASGSLNGAGQLDKLRDKAANRAVLVLVPGSDVALRSVALPGKLTRQVKQALPYMLEEELAADVDSLHFSVLGIEDGLARVAAVDVAKMGNWLRWLADAGLKTRQLLPDLLCLPIEERCWSAVQLDEEWLVRQGAYHGLVAEPLLMPFLLEKQITETIPEQISSYSPIPEQAPGNWQLQELDLPMQILALGALGSKVNLLTGEFQPQKEYSKNWGYWKKVVIVAGICLSVGLVDNFMTLQTLKKEEQALKEQITNVYRQVFPEQKNVRYARIKRQIKQQLAAMDSSAGQTGFLYFLDELIPAFSKVPGFTPLSLKYDSQRREVRIQATASSFQSFEAFREAAGGKFEVKQGALSNQAGLVSGSLTIRSL